jgi:hypothetical protein
MDAVNAIRQGRQDDQSSGQGGRPGHRRGRLTGAAMEGAEFVQAASRCGVRRGPHTRLAADRNLPAADSGGRDRGWEKHDPRRAAAGRASL